ncbi:hypothetical protein [Nonomuraea roseola]|uniref:Uncharacterized protein n=1 Tax=Nonomuraea roseola TaxID=46179 RepID=A0ABV5PW17_9ACTN
MDLAAQVGAGEVVAGEDGADGAAEFLVNEVFGAAASEAALEKRAWDIPLIFDV